MTPFVTSRQNVLLNVDTVTLEPLSTSVKFQTCDGASMHVWIVTPAPFTPLFAVRQRPAFAPGVTTPGELAGACANAAAARAERARSL